MIFDKIKIVSVKIGHFILGKKGEKKLCEALN